MARKRVVLPPNAGIYTCDLKKTPNGGDSFGAASRIKKYASIFFYLSICTTFAVNNTLYYAIL